MHILIMAIIIILALILGYALYGKKKDKPTQHPNPFPTIDKPRMPPTGRYIILNDFQHSLTSTGSGDPDSAQDFAFQIALMFQHSLVPIAVGATWMEGDPVDTIPRKLLALSKLDVPVLLGSAYKRGGPSELANLIINESKKRSAGELHLVVGGTTADIRYAFQNGADALNVILYLTPNTWNSNNSEGATEFIMRKAKRVSTIPPEHLWHDLGTKGGSLKILGLAPYVWINNKRHNAMWEAGNKADKLHQIRAMNTQMGSTQSEHPLRAADYRHLADFFKLPSGNHDEIHRHVDNGIKILDGVLAARLSIFGGQ